jgi:hypothetical protein
MNCVHVTKAGSPGPVGVSQEGALCSKCVQQHQYAIRTPGNAAWVNEVLEAVEEVWSRTSEQTPSADSASLWDLFELESHNGGPGKFSDRGNVLSRVDVKVLKDLRKWLDENLEEAARRYGPNRTCALRADVGSLAWLRAIPQQNEDPFPKHGDETLPLAAVAYSSSGRTVDLTIPIRLERLRQKPGFRGQRDLAEALGISRSYLRDVIRRMQEVGFALGKPFTTDVLEYIAMGSTRGRPKNKEE